MSYRLLETMLLLEGRVIRNQARHLARLENSCRENGFLFDAIPARLADFVASQPEGEQQKIRLICSANGEIELTAQPYSPPEVELCLQLVHQPISGFSQMQFSHKFADSPLREFYSTALASLGPAVHHCLFDCLFINEAGIVTEGTRCNFYVEIAGQLITSPVSAGLMPGTYRRLLIDQGCLVEPITLEMLEKADRYWVSNALIAKKEVVSQNLFSSL